MENLLKQEPHSPYVSNNFTNALRMTPPHPDSGINISTQSCQNVSNVNTMETEQQMLNQQQFLQDLKFRQQYVPMSSENMSLTPNGEDSPQYSTHGNDNMEFNFQETLNHPDVVNAVENLLNLNHPINESPDFMVQNMQFHQHQPSAPAVVQFAPESQHQVFNNNFNSFQDGPGLNNNYQVPQNPNTKEHFCRNQVENLLLKVAPSGNGMIAENCSSETELMGYLGFDQLKSVMMDAFNGNEEHFVVDTLSRHIALAAGISQSEYKKQLLS